MNIFLHQRTGETESREAGPSSRRLSVDPDLMREAIRLKRELEELGLWEDNGPQVLGPFELNPDSPYLAPTIEQLISRRVGFLNTYSV